MKGCDHSTAGVAIGGALKAAGYVGVFRYAAEGRGDVNINRSEYDDLKAHGIEVAIVNEHSAAYLLGGYQVGHDRALGARQVCRDAGLPDGVIYMGGDSESLQTSQGNLAAVAAAMRGCGDAVGMDNAGYYGSYYVIDYLVNHEPWIRYYWQTVAWSSGHLHPRANAFQHAATATVGGVDLDLDDLLTQDWGQRGGAPTPPVQEDIDMPTMLALHNDDGRLEEWVINASGHPAQRFKKQDGSWSDWRSFPIPSTAIELNGSKHKNGILEVFARGQDKRHYRNWQDGPNGEYQSSFTSF